MYLEIANQSKSIKTNSFVVRKHPFTEHLISHESFVCIEALIQFE